MNDKLKKLAQERNTERLSRKALHDRDQVVGWLRDNLDDARTMFAVLEATVDDFRFRSETVIPMINDLIVAMVNVRELRTMIEDDPIASMWPEKNP